ncbi:hypothetical protein Daus18300_001424 [Diaporthe australafricana]|uniref:Uncharacterized protein n=1 Tax=Diaporthe australafricana TaxID=127596 RepID=A0ABR3XWG7_9PEZI
MSSDAFFKFSTIQEARNVFEYSLYLFTSSGPARPSCDTEPSAELLPGQVDYFTTLMTKFSNAMRVFMDTSGSFLTPRERTSAAALQLHVLNSYVSFYTEYLPPACRPHSNALLPKMKEMVSLCEEIIPSISDGTESVDQRTSFCLDIGYIIPLYTVASQCHDIATRRRVIALLRSTPRQEGLWNSLVVAKAAERILEIERGTGKRLEPGAPVASLTTSPRPRTVLQLDGKGVRLQYVKQGQDTAVPTRVVEEVVTW